MYIWPVSLKDREGKETYIGTHVEDGVTGM